MRKETNVQAANVDVEEKSAPPRSGSRLRVVGHSLGLRLELLGLRDGQLGFRVRLGLGSCTRGQIIFQCLCYFAIPLCIASMHLTRCVL